MTSGTEGGQAGPCLRLLSVLPWLLHGYEGIPGWRVESTAFFACHSSGVIEGIFPCLYCVTRVLACSRAVLDMNSVLCRLSAETLAKQSKLESFRRR